MAGNPTGVRRRKPFHDERTKDKIRLSQVENRLNDHGFGKIELTQTQVTALRAIYDKLRPSLQAIEQHNIEEVPVEQDIITTLKGVLERDPGLRTQLKALILGMPAVVEQPEIATKAA